MATNTWYHVAGVFDGSTLRIYINGVPVGSAPYTGFHTGSPYPLNVGRDPYDTSRLFDGMIEEVRIWNVARTQAQIQTDMTRTLTSTTPGLVVNWRLDEGSGDVAHDR